MNPQQPSNQQGEPVDAEMTGTSDDPAEQQLQQEAALATAPSTSARQTASQNQASTGAPAPASPPLPQPPKPVAPGPRASRFQDVLASSLRHTLAKVSYENFASCYPTTATKNPALLRAVQTQMVERLGLLCQKEFASVLMSRSVVAKLNELESLVSQAEQRRGDAQMSGDDNMPIPIRKTRDPVRSPIDKPDTAGLVVGSVTTSESPVFPHTLPPAQVLSAHLAPHLAQQQSQLNARLQTTQAHNARLWDQVSRQRAEIEHLSQLAERVLADVDAANGMLDGVVDDLARETREVEAENMASAAAVN